MNPSPAPLVSVLVPIYNVERYLRQCLESLRDQTLRDIEVICVNDGSTDGSRAIVGEFLDVDGRFRVIDKPNSGYGAAMNRGLDAARGTYVGILESDDFLDPEALETMWRAAEEADVDVVKCDFYFHWSTPEPRDERFGFTSPERSGLVSTREVTDVFYLKPSIWSALYRRSFLERHGIRFLETPGASYQDTSFNFKVWAHARRAVLIDRAFLHYRQDNEASSINSSGKAYCICDEYDEMVRFLEGDPELKRELTPILVKMRYDTYMWNYDRLSEELKEGWVRRMAEDFRAEDAAGIVDYSLFEPARAADRRALMENPTLFHERRRRWLGRGPLQTAWYYCRLGGPGLVGRIVGDKLGSGRHGRR